MVAETQAPRTAPFVGRTDHLALVDRLIADRQGPWRLWITADAGEGKSRLLQTILEHHGANDGPADALDFFVDGLRTESGILIELAGRFGVADTPAFAQALADYQTAKPDDRASRRHAQSRMETALVEALQSRFAGGKRGLIPFDTVELISPLYLNNWLFNEFLPQLKRDVLVIACGRPEPPNRPLADPHPEGETLRLGELTREEVAEYVQALAPIYADPPERIDHIYAITRGKGQALLLALLIEKLTAPPTGTRIQWGELQSWDNDRLREELVDGPLTDAGPLSQVLLYLTHAYHGLDADMLAYLMAPEVLGTEDYPGYLRSLRPYAFIKYHEDRDNPARSLVRLHDYFRERSLALLQEDLDRSLGMRRWLSGRLAGYFEKALEGEDGAISPRRDRLTQQYFYHRLFAEPRSASAYGEFWELLDTLWHEGRYDYMDVLLTMARDVAAVLRGAGHEEPILESLEKAARAWMMLEAYGEKSREEAITLADEILATDDIPRRLKLTALVAKGTAVGEGAAEATAGAESDEQGPADRGIALLEEARRGYDELLGALAEAEDGDMGARKIINAEAGLSTVRGIRPERYLILNTIGYLERARGRYREAEAAYRKAYDLSAAEDNPRWQASSATNLGTVSRYLGRMGEAFDWLYIGLNNRQELGIPDQIAFGLAALGRLERDHFDLPQARGHFEQARDIWAGLDAARDHTTMLFELGWVDVLLGRFDEADRQFEQAERAVTDRRLAMLLPDLREKQGKSLLRRARQLPDEAARRELLDRAESLLGEGLEEGRKRQQYIYVVNCLAALCRIAEMKGEDDRIAPWEAEMRAFSDRDYEFKPAYADLEEVLGDVAMRRAGDPGSPDFDPAWFDRATDHYLRQMLYLGRFSDHLYHRGMRALREGLLEMPPDLRRRAGRRLVEGWQAEPDVAERHDGFIRTVRNMAGI